MARSEVAGQALKEAGAINRSLAALGDVVAALQRRAQHIPYRNSRLTQARAAKIKQLWHRVWWLCCSPAAMHPLLQTASDTGQCH